MFAEIISVGDEILIGQIVNNNAAWMAQQLNLIGISVGRISTVGDNRGQLLRIFSEASKRSNIILITGGLGPTSDDITKPCLCEFFGVQLIFNREIFEDVKRLFRERNIPMPVANRGQAEVPENCTPIKNLHGTAPGMWFEIQSPETINNSMGLPKALTAPANNQSENREGNSQIWVSLPGVPYEMKAMMNDFVLPELKKRFRSHSIIHKTVYTQGMGESALAERINEWEESLSSEGIKLAYLPSPGQVRLRLSANGDNENELIASIEKKITELKKIIPGLIFAVEDFGKEPETIEKVVGELLQKKKKTLSIAESCTGGYLGHLITSVPGSSDYFKGGIISYSNEIKINELRASEKMLKSKGAVSKEIAEQMARGIRKKMNSTFGIGITGIAGPSGGSPEKPVGTVWIAVASTKKTVSEKFSFGNDRERNIRKSALSALNMLRIILENPVD